MWINFSNTLFQLEKGIFTKHQTAGGYIICYEGNASPMLRDQRFKELADMLISQPITKD